MNSYKMLQNGNSGIAVRYRLVDSLDVEWAPQYALTSKLQRISTFSANTYIRIFKIYFLAKTAVTLRRHYSVLVE